MALDPEFEQASLLRWAQTIGATRAIGASTYTMPVSIGDGMHTRIGGPQLIGSSVMALSDSVDVTTLHSLKVQFLQLGNPEAPLTLSIRPLRDTRNFTTRQVAVKQGDEECAIVTCSFTPIWEGMSHHSASPPDYEPPEQVPEVWEAYGGRRVVTLPAEVRLRQLDGQPAIRWHQRAFDGFSADPSQRAALLAALTDGQVAGTALHHFGLPFGSQASMDHQVWFHRPFRWEGWLHGEAWSDVAAGNRAMVHGRLWDEQAQLVATIAQEVSYRRPSPA